MLTALLVLLVGILVILAIIAANGFFVAQEFAYMSVDRVRLRASADAGDSAARSALRITDRTSFMLSGAQLGITVTGLLVGYVAEPLVGESLGTLFDGVGIPPAVSISVGTVLALGLSTIVQMLFGELYPKNLAIANPEPLAKALAAPTRVYLILFGWLVTFFDRSSNLLLRLLRIEPIEDIDQSATAQDLGHIVNDSRSSGDLSADMSLILDRILDFPHRTVEHAMVPRNRVDVVQADTPVAEVRRRMAGAHTRYPVVEEERLVGLVHLIDLLPVASDTSQTTADLMRDVTVVPGLMSLPTALERLRTNGEEMVCVVDEHGSFDGILTAEDLAEEVAGELTDEHDDEPTPLIGHVEDGVWNVAGDVHLDEVERAIGHNLPRGDYETVAGLVIAEHGDLPEPGDSVRVDLDPEGAELAEDEPPRRFLTVEVVRLESHVPSETVVELHEDGGDDR
ncbi:MAG: hemolysin family protein [Brachybacterium tyrofermentans]